MPQNTDSEYFLTKEILKIKDIRPSRFLLWMLYPWVVIIVVSLGVGAYAFSLIWPETTLTSLPTTTSSSTLLNSNLDIFIKVLTVASAAVTFSITYAHWYLTRKEITLEKLYEKIKDVNKFINDYELERWANNPEKKLIHLLNMRVFSQLDNLEYMLQKYRRGYVDYDVVHRAIGTFRAECKDESFIEQLLYWIGDCDAKHKAEGTPIYVRNAARYIAKNHNCTEKYNSLREAKLDFETFELKATR